jgi:N-acetylmuramoyl-L-alanine amidase
MSIRIKNGKLYTYNICKAKLIFIILITIHVSASGTGTRYDKNWVIVIDAGHGGKDPGAIGSFSSEKNITLPIALKTGEYIEQNIKKVTLIYTRDNDSFVEIRDRADIANKNKADLFISIHANWAKSKNVHGTETFFMGITKDQQNLEVAMKENEVILLENDYTTKYEGFDPKSTESYVMFSLMQNIFQKQSQSLAWRIQTQYKEKNDRIDRGVKQAGFVVLFMTTMPSVLTETGFITNQSEEKYLNSKEGQDYIASSIFRACRDYINEIDSKSGISAVVEQNPVQKVTKDITEKTVEGEIVYMVQVLSSSAKIEIKPGNFKGLIDITEIKTSERYRYASGRLPGYAEAVKFRNQLREIYPDAFVIAVRDNKILPLQQALEQEKKKQNAPINEKDLK